MKKYELLENVYKSNLPSRAKQVMFYLINRANGEGRYFPSIKTIASDCGVSTRTMVILLEAGFVKKYSRFREKKEGRIQIFIYWCTLLKIMRMNVKKSLRKKKLKI